ncbi:HNH endonuclease [Knoellia locipacati]|uniref:HNH endonuclease signature motif containing protein n=1 Tax=Knoellia locipacati TaxID=882824 RepID=UPI00384E7AA8
MTEGTAEQPGLSYAECVARIAAAHEAAAALPSVLWQASGADLVNGLEALGELSAVSEGAEVAITTEAIERGEPGCASPPQTPREWVVAHHRRYAVAGASRLVDVAQACRDTRHHILRAAVVSGRVSIGTAQVALKEMRLLKPHLHPDAVDTVWDGLMTLGERHDARTVRQLRERLLAAYGADDAFEDTEDKARQGAGLTVGKEIAPGLFEYLLRVTREGRALLEAAIGPLSAPTPGSDGERDERPHEQRRAEALVAVIGRALKAGDSAWSSTKTQVFVTVGLEDLQRSAGAGSLLGALTTGDLVTADTVRRWACDATVIPAVLNSCGEVVDLGRAERLFTPAQIKRLWLRDRHCTYPGCDAPAAWTDAHHLIHWADDGPSDLSNAALLCQRHHTTVHSRRLHGHVTIDDDGRQRVTWDLTRGSYDTALTHPDPGLGRGPAAGQIRQPHHEQRVSGDDTTWHRP